MPYNEHSSDLIESEINNQTFVNYKPSINYSETESKAKGEACKRVNGDNTQQNETTSDPKYSKLTAAGHSISSTDSGVNTNDTQNITPTSYPSTTSHLQSFQNNMTASHCCEQFHKNNENTNCDNNVNSNEGNNCKIVNNKTNNNNINDNNDVDYGDESDNINSANVDNKIKVADSSKEGKSTRYQKEIQNAIECKNVKTISQQRNFETTTSATSTESYNKPSLQHNDFVSFEQRPVSPTSSLSMSSIVSSNDNYLPSNMHHCADSPVVSIRSISSIVITSDSDTDSDFNSDIDNYVIKKLGTQVAYPPNDPAIPNINSGHKVINQKVIPNSNQPSLQPLEALAVLGDRIGAAQALGPKSSGVPQRPQIGSIAVSNSSDVTFGDKHFYEGPVTIQQFLIDSREKPNGKENSMFANESTEPGAHNAKDINTTAEKSSSIYEYVLKRKKMIIPGALAFTALLILATIWGSKMLNDSKNTNNNNSDYHDDCVGNGTLCIIERDVWGALPPSDALDKQKLPLHRAVISHTASESCDSPRTCFYRVRLIQEFHMNSFGWDDIAYNFLISSDGRVYVGRGWDYVGAHTKGYNYDSVGITFIGTYNSIQPSKAQLNACLLLLEEGIRLKKLVPDYRLYGARQLGSTESPGDVLYKEIKTWQHWSANIKSI